MALSMCLSLVPDVSVSAADDSASYTVTLGDADGGQVEFYNSESGTTESVTDKQYAEGDTVEVKLTADDGYSIGGFVINDTDGAELYSDDTSDDVFEFTMPEMDIVVGGKFTKRHRKYRRGRGHSGQCRLQDVYHRGYFYSDPGTA